MENEQVKVIAQQVFDENSTKHQFDVSQTPFHSHNGIDSSRFPFLNLSDVPNSYYTFAGSIVVVNSTATGLTFSPSLSGNGGKAIIVNAAGTGLSFGGKIGTSGPLFDHYADVNNGTTLETNLYSDNIPASAFTTNGDKIFARYQGIFTGAAASTQELRLYFGGTKIYDSGALSIGVATDNWTAEVLLIRESATIMRASVSISSDFATLFPYSAYTKVTGLTLSLAQFLQITGQAAGAGAASNQITATMGSILSVSAA